MTDEKPKLRLASKTKTPETPPLRQTHPVHPAIHELAKLLAKQAVREYLEEEERQVAKVQEKEE